MPTYQDLKTYEAGFYNNKRTGDVDDRVYSAKDVREPYCTVFSKGIMPDTDGTAGGYLKVTANGGMGISVAAGTANLGAWFKNTGAYSITLDPSGGSVRYDCVIIRSDDISTTRSDNVAVDREPSIYIKSLTAVPTINDLIRNDNTYEMCIAYVKVKALATSITSADIIDTRTDGSLCNVMSGVGATVVRVYKNTYFSQTENQTVIPIGIAQYNRSKDALSVIVEGRTFTEGVNYTITDNSQITLAVGLPIVGTKIEFEVAKNVNAAGAETVVQEVNELRKEMTANNNKLRHYYYCNGLTDNINISNIVKEFLSLSSYNSMDLHVVGHFGFTQMAAGSGTSGNPYKLFDFGTFGTLPNPKVFIDFSDCDEISVPVTDGTNNVIFGGSSFNIRGANVIASNTTVNTIIRVIDPNVKVVKATDCRFWITAYKNSLIAWNGTFENCRGSVANIVENSYCFQPASAGIVRIIGGEYYAYSTSGYSSAIVGQSGANAVSILYGVNAPTLARSGFVQTNSLLQWTSGGTMNCTDLVSALPMTVAAGISNIRGTIALSKAGLM